MPQLLANVILLFLTLSPTVLSAETSDTHRHSTNHLRFIAAAEIPLDATIENIQIGGLSSLYFDVAKGHLIAISDDKGRISGPVLHHFTVTLSMHDIAITPNSITKLRNASGENVYPQEIIDAEAFDRLNNGHWLVSSEGIDLEKYFTLPALLEFNQDGLLVKRWVLPEKFLPKQEDRPNYGIRPNDAFEGLSLTPDKRHLFLVNEKALLQDGDVSISQRGSLTRIVRMALDNNSEPNRVQEFIYPLSELPNPDASDVVEGFLSISDILAINKNQLVVVEKSFLTKPVVRNTVQLFIADITPETTDVSSFDSLTEGQHQVALKNLWADLNDFTNLDGFPRLDNVEGIILGPPLNNGNNTLILVTDNNFSGRQKTLFYAFEILDSLPSLAHTLN